MRTVLSSAPPDPAVKTYKMYYGGQWHDAADGGHFDVHEPYSGKLFARVPTGGPQDAAAAIQAAAEAFPAWAATPPAERARLLLTAGEIVKRRRTEIADMLARETGSTISFSTFQQPTNPTERRSSVSIQQRETLDAILRQSAFPPGSDVNEQRRLLKELLSAQPLPAEVTVTAAALGGVPTAEITVDGIEPRDVVLYFHGGVYVMGDAFLAADLASQVGRRTRAKVISVDYRLAPEHPYPAAVDDALAAYEALLHNGIAPSDIALAGESAGGALAIATLVNARDHGLPLPAAAFVMSPYADLTLAGTTMETRREVDPLMSRDRLQPRVTDYTAGQDAALGLISPIFADLSGLPPLIIQAGTHEVLLDDAIRLAQQAATSDVEFTLDITPGVPHVFQAYHGILDEGAAALDRAGQLLSAHLAGAGRVTA